MKLDALLNFVPVGSPLALAGGVGVNIPSTNIIDLLGQGVGSAPGNIIGNAGVFGQDPGVGKERPEIVAAIGVTPVTPNGATLNVAIQYAPDQGAGGNYQPGAWQTIAETGPMLAAQLPAGTKIARLPWLPAFPEGVRPRYVRLLFQVQGGGNFTAGSVAYAAVALGRDDQANKFAANNYAAP